MTDQLLFSVGAILIFAGFIIAFVAVILMFFATTRGRGKVRGGGAVIVGPFPIVFGTDRESVKMLLILSVALIALTLIVTVVFHYYS